MKQKPEKATPPKQSWPFPFNILQEEWREVKRARRSFALCAVAFLIIGGTIIYSLFKSFVIPGMEKTIQALETTSRTQNQNRIPTGPPVVWPGPTNSLSVSNQYCIYRAATDCASTNVVNPSSPAVAYAVVMIHNTSSKQISVSMTDPSIRRVGYDTTSSMTVSSGRIGVISVNCYGSDMGVYAAVPQQ
jgi:hypothetical protein